MKTFDLFKEIISSVLANKLRSGLTILGIVIGIASVIIMISLGQGVKYQFEEQIKTVGSNLLIILPGAQRTFSPFGAARGTAQTLTLEDVKAIKEIDYVTGVSPVYNLNYQVVSKYKNTRTRILGANEEIFFVRKYDIDLGRAFEKKDIVSMSRVAVLGPLTKEDLFPNYVNPIGEKIKINGVLFTVIGVTKPKTQEQDDLIFIPHATAKQYFSKTDYVSAIFFSVRDFNLIEPAREEVTRLLMEKHKIKENEDPDFTVFTQNDMLSFANSFSNLITIFLSSIASISLIVGGIGIMNMMFTSVTERTKEIGLRKAIGAKNKDISLQFLGESIILTLIGGIIGVILGYLISLGISKFFNLETKVSLFSIFLAFGVCSLIGIIFGYWPAKRASKLDPIEALRYE